MDIDECMVHSIFEEDQGYRQDDERMLTKSDTSALEIRHLACEDGAPVKVHIRPFLDEFLTNAREHYNVYAFTAALPVYARPVLSSLDKDSDIFQDAWFREDCTLMNVNGHRLYTKDVIKTARLDPKRTVLVDNNIFSFLPIPRNGLHVTNFTDDSNDRELENLIPFIHALGEAADVRVPLTDIFQLEKRLRAIYDTMKATNHE